MAVRQAQAVLGGGHNDRRGGPRPARKRLRSGGLVRAAAKGEERPHPAHRKGDKRSLRARGGVAEPQDFAEDGGSIWASTVLCKAESVYRLGAA